MQKKETLFVFAGLCHQVITKCVFWAVSVATQLGCVVNVKSVVRLLLSRGVSPIGRGALFEKGIVLQK